MDENELRGRLKVLEEAVAWIGAHLPSLQATQDLRRHLGNTPLANDGVEKAADALLRRIEVIQQKRS